jgi:hypothetical protein
VVTATAFPPPVPGGVVAVIWVAESTVKPLTASPSMVTAVAPERLVPVITTVWPPATGPEAGLIVVKVGADT